MGAIVRLLTIGLLLLAAGGAAAAPAKRSSDLKPDRFDLLQMRQPMIFFVAKGTPDSCGPGCNEWIAAEGLFDKGTVKRFQHFLDALSRRDLPIFFSSLGGRLGEAETLGRVLRENRMTTAVGRTIPDGCTGSAINDACRRVMQSKREHKARLVTRDARCDSACVYAFLGGAQRQIAHDAKLGIHSSRLASKFATAGAPSIRSRTATTN
jgi:hypothetical protein